VAETDWKVSSDGAARKIDLMVHPAKPGNGRIAAVAALVAATALLLENSSDAVVAFLPFGAMAAMLMLLYVAESEDRKESSGDTWQTFVAFSGVFLQLGLVAGSGSAGVDVSPVVLPATLVVGWNLLLAAVRATVYRDPDMMLRRGVLRTLEERDGDPFRHLLQVRAAYCDAVEGRQGTSWWAKNAGRSEDARMLVCREQSRAFSKWEPGEDLLHKVWKAEASDMQVVCCKAHRLFFHQGTVGLYRRLTALQNASAAFNLLRRDLSVPWETIPEKLRRNVRNLLRKLPERQVARLGRIPLLLAEHRWTDGDVPARPQRKEAAARVEAVEKALHGRQARLMDGLLAGWQQDADTLTEAVRAL